MDGWNEDRTKSNDEEKKNKQIWKRQPSAFGANETERKHIDDRMISGCCLFFHLDEPARTGSGTTTRFGACDGKKMGPIATGEHIFNQVDCGDDDDDDGEMLYQNRNGIEKPGLN